GLSSSTQAVLKALKPVALGGAETVCIMLTTRAPLAVDDDVLGPSEPTVTVTARPLTRGGGDAVPWWDFYFAPFFFGKFLTASPHGDSAVPPGGGADT